jgi:hypothetical protein
MFREREEQKFSVKIFAFFDSCNKDISNNWFEIDYALTITFEFQKKEVRNDTIYHFPSALR